MAGIARPFIPWIGSKEKLIPYIWQVFPSNPKLYLEPFGGGGALLLGIQPKISRMDIYNDFNCDLVNLFLCARECTIQLVQELKFLPLHSRAEFDLLKEFMKHRELLQQRIADERNAVMECFSGEEREELLQILRGRSNLFDVQRAAAYYKVCRGSFSGTTSSFGVKPNNLTNFLYLFDDASKRLQDVIIENKDCLDIIRERDGPDSLIYCDPPYFDAESLYAVDFPKEKHEELHWILSQCKGYIVVSYNDCPFIRSLYGDFFILAFRRNNPLSQKPGATYGELIITNYDPRPYIQPQFKIRPHVIHLMRGQAFELQGRTFFTMGGAQSHDIADGILDMDSPDFYERYDSMRRNRGQFRINHISWWQEELPSDEEYAEARQTLKRLDWKVDYIITHCAPTAIQQKINANFRPNKLTDFLEEVRSRSQFHYWLFGHYHDNRIIDEKYVMLYEQMVRIL